MQTAMEYASIKNQYKADLSGSGIDRYLKEISRYQLLSREETERLARRVYEEGDRQAGSRLIIANLRLVVKVVSDFQKYWMNNFLDLIQEGNIGLAKAVSKFDPHRGVKFSSYAAYWIRAYILKFVMDNWRLVKIGTTQAQRKLFYRLNKEKKLLESKGIKPTTSLLAQRLDVKEAEIINMSERLDHYDLSLAAPVRENSGMAQENFLAGEGPSLEERVADREFIEWFRRTLDGLRDDLTERERVILYERLLDDEPRTLNNIAAQFGVSRERVRQIEAALLEKLRDLLAGQLDVL